MGRTRAANARSGQVGPVVIGRRRIARRVGELAREISACYAGGELTILGVLTGSLIFLADLVRRLPLAVRLTFVAVGSYPGRATESRGARIKSPFPSDLAGRHVLVVDDILDTGQTLRALLRTIKARRPASLRTCVLLRKDRPDLPDRPEVDFVGFQVERKFVVGYGLDYDNLYRNLPDIRVLSAPIGRPGRVRGKR